MRSSTSAGAARLIASQVRKDLLIWSRRPIVILATVAPPLAYTVVIFFVSITIGRNPVAVVVQSPTPQAMRLAAVMQQSNEFIAHEMSASAARAALRSMAIEAIVTIPARFDDDLRVHRASVTMLVNNVNADEANDLRRSLPAAVTTFAQAGPHNPLTISMVEHDLHAHDFTLGQFEFIPILVFVLTVAGVICAGLNSAEEWEAGTIKELLLAPSRRWMLVLSKLTAGWIQTMVLGTAVLALGAAAGFVRIRVGAIPLGLAVLVLIGLASTAVGTALGVVFRRLVIMHPIGLHIALGMFFLSGGVSEIGFLPHFVQQAAPFVPTYYAVHALDRMTFYTTLAGVARDLAIVGSVALAAVAVSIIVFNRRLLD
jgi:ABC-2 type transport system permease protein